MSKYIKQDDIFELVRTGRLVGNSNFESVCKHIGSLPTIDIVRCEECRHWDDRRKDAWWSEEGACKRTSRLGDAIYQKHDDSCSYGERIDNE